MNIMTLNGWYVKDNDPAQMLGTTLTVAIWEGLVYDYDAVMMREARFITDCRPIPYSPCDRFLRLSDTLGFWMDPPSLGRLKGAIAAL
jgi:hypothetical protein